jgi:glutamyl/glutaminyl-tRNA synthetase
MQFKKTRYAPTPSGFLHLGNVYSMALTAVLAKKEGADIVLRIDDLDRSRMRKDYVQDIFECLNFIDLPWQQGPKNQVEFEQRFSQVNRLVLYESLLKQLVDKGKVFACRCSRSEIEHSGSHAHYPGTCINKNIPLDEKNVCWRLDTSDELQLNLTEYSKTSGTYLLPESMHNFIVRRKDGLPSYQVCSMMDDVFFGIDLIVRGKDLWDSSLAQLYLAQLTGHGDFLKASFLHHPLLQTGEGKKLSKSAGDTSIKTMRNKGMTQGDIYSLLGDYFGLNIRNWEDLPIP